MTGKAGKRRLAESLGVSVEELQAARRAEMQASAGLVGTPAGERRRMAARRLQISPDELTILRKALNGHLPQRPTRAAMLVRTVLSGTTTAPARSAAPAHARTSKAQTPLRKKNVAGGVAKNRSSGRPVPLGSKSSPTSSVYVTTWGNVVHLYHDCHSMRGFRNTAETDPDIYRVAAKDPCCRGRRVCGTCSNISPAIAARLGQLLVSLHGKPFDETEWQRNGWHRALPTGDPINRRRR